MIALEHVGESFNAQLTDCILSKPNGVDRFIRPKARGQRAGTDDREVVAANVERNNLRAAGNGIGKYFDSIVTELVIVHIKLRDGGIIGPETSANILDKSIPRQSSTSPGGTSGLTCIALLIASFDIKLLDA